MKSLTFVLWLFCILILVLFFNHPQVGYGFGRFNCERNDPGYRRGYHSIHCYSPHPCHSGSDCQPKSSPPSPNPSVQVLEVFRE